MDDSPVFPTSPLERVREGMTVVDEFGRRLGTVARIGMGDPQAATTQGEGLLAGDPGVVAAPATGTGGTTGVGVAAPFLGDHPFGPDVPDQLVSELLRAGFIEVDGPDLKGAARYISGERIAEVSGDTVRLAPLAPSAAVASSSRSGAPPPGATPASASPAAGTTSASGSATGTASEPVLRTYVGPVRDQGAPLPVRLLVMAAGAVVAGGLAGAAWVAWRRRQERRQPLSRLRYTSQALAESLADRQRGWTVLGSALLLALALLRRGSSGRSAGREPLDGAASVEVTVRGKRKRR